MNIRFKSVLFFLAMIFVVGLSSCSDDEDIAAPVITIKEIGYEDGRTVNAGEELHIEADVIADGLISEIKVDLHPEEGSGDDIEREWTNYAGQKNAEFHEHIEIPANATAGEYHFHLKVIDQEGQTSEVDADVIVQ